jgi:hypothetical protein
MHIFCWNCRGLDKSQRKRLLKNYILDHNIDILDIQETKLETLPSRTINYFSIFISNWIFIVIKESFYSILDIFILDYSVTIHLRNKNDSFEWFFTVVYGPIIHSKR